MKTLNVKRSILLVLAATFSFLLFTGCEKDPEMLLPQGGAEAAPHQFTGDPLKVEEERVLAAEPRHDPPLGYEEMKTVLVGACFKGSALEPMNGKQIAEFEIKQIITHPDFFSKPIIKMPYAKVKNLLGHSVKCTYVLEFMAGTFPWRINGEIVMKPHEEIELGVLPLFSGVITDGIFTATIQNLQVYDEYDGTIGSGL